MLGRWAAPLGVDARRAVFVPTPRRGLVAKAVPHEIEPGARADLERVERAEAREREEARQQRDGSPRLVGLRRVAQEGSNPLLLSLENGARQGPQRIHVPA